MMGDIHQIFDKNRPTRPIFITDVSGCVNFMGYLLKISPPLPGGAKNKGPSGLIFRMKERI